jgi:two-component system, NtrC family, C4-dicarboxylate transport sensor histidine kinase DctB
MSVKSSFFVLVMLTFFAAIGLEFFMWQSERDKVNLMAEAYAKEQSAGLKQLLALKSDPMKKQTLDYAIWNDLVNFIENPNDTWIEDNLAGSTVQFSLDGFYILDASKKILFSETSKPFMQALNDLIQVELLNLSKEELMHFFVQKEQQVVEFYIAPIRRLHYVVNENALASGFVVIAKHWDEAFINELSSYGLAKVYLNKLKPLKDTYSIVDEIALRDYKGMKISTLYLHIPNRMGEVLDTYATKDMMLNFIHTLVLMLIFMALIAKYIGFPLRDITLSLTQKSKDPLQKYLPKHNEYGAIARALCDAFDTKATLEDLNQHLKQTIQEEVEKSRIKDRILFQQAKLVALGEMLNNIAHQWRQPLSTISVIINRIFLESQSKKLTPLVLEEEIRKLRGILAHMSSTIDDFKDFFKPDKGKVLFYLNGCMDESVKISDGGVANQGVEFEIDCPADLAMYGFKRELSHVFLVLINNAKDAIKEHHVEHGCIRLRAYEQEHYIIIEVADNGGGIDEAKLPYIFDPFFTTKETTKGSGTGLYMAKQIIEQSMQGSIAIGNEEEGVVVTIVLPKDDID